VAPALAASLAGQKHSLVDISHRLAGLEIAGRDADIVLAAFCPLDLRISAFPVGMCTRTVLAKAEIVLWRTEANKFRLEAARSFGAYVLALVEEACREFAA
ncbi:MAG TPA: sarcosine oxidase subunit gamma family protein, partial [Stellaceae bacterium]|nr:sarcosine oxidase subunit gamma family protein [Stellaceae bacterium]